MPNYPPRRRGRPVRRLAIVGLVVLVAWAGGLFMFAEQIPKQASDDRRRTDAIVVLTGGSGRLDEGLRLLSAGLADRLFVSGVYQGLDVKALLRLWQKNPADLEQRIGIGGATDTQGNARETAQWVAAEAVTSLRLVTSGYHMPRSLLEFRQAMAGIEIIAHPVLVDHVKVGRWWAWPGTAGLIISEYNKFLLAWVRHMGENLFSGPQQS